MRALLRFSVYLQLHCCVQDVLSLLAAWYHALLTGNYILIANPTVGTIYFFFKKIDSRSKTVFLTYTFCYKVKLV